MAGENDNGGGIDPAALLQQLASRGMPNTASNANALMGQRRYNEPQPMPQPYTVPTVPGTPPIASAPAPTPAPVSSGAGALPQPPPIPPGAPDTAAPVAAPVAGAVDPAASGDSGGILQAIATAILGSGALGAGAYGLSRLGRAPSTQGPIPGAGAAPGMAPGPNVSGMSMDRDPFADLNDLKGKQTYDHASGSGMRGETIPPQGQAGGPVQQRGPTIDGTADPMQSAMSKAVDESPRSLSGPVKQLENASEATTAANTQQKQLATPTERSGVKTADAKAAIEGNNPQATTEALTPAESTNIRPTGPGRDFSRAPQTTLMKSPMPTGALDWEKILGGLGKLGKVIR